LGPQHDEGFVGLVKFKNGLSQKKLGKDYVEDHPTIFARQLHNLDVLSSWKVWVLYSPGAGQNGKGATQYDVGCSAAVGVRLLTS